MILTDLRQNISNLINESGLPIDAIYYVIKDVMSEIVGIYNQQLEMERNAAAAQETQSAEKVEETEAAAQSKEEEEK